MQNKKIKIGLICSPGGHLFQLYQLKPWWSNYDHFWVTGPGEDSNFFLKHERTYFGHFPEQRNVKNAFRNLFLAWKILKKEKPDLLVSTGAGIAPPFFIVGKLFKCKLIFIELFGFVEFPTLSGKFISYFSDLFLIQNKEQKKFFKHAKYWGEAL